MHNDNNMTQLLNSHVGALIQTEICKRILEQDQHLKNKKELRDQTKVILEALEEVTDLSNTEMEKIAIHVVTDDEYWFKAFFAILIILWIYLGFKLIWQLL